MTSYSNIPDKFDPEPAVFSGGLDRMIRLWEMCRDLNTGGYGSGILTAVKGWGGGGVDVTSCSPFTGNVIGMMFDPDGGEDPKKTYAPKFNGGSALPQDFYSLHNGNYFSVESEPDPNAKPYKDNPRRYKEALAFYKYTVARAAARKALWGRNQWSFNINDSAHSCVFFGLGYQIDPRDMRRGDLVAIDWMNNGGHATFCWDVHLDAGGAVDCFSFLSSNGTKTPSGAYAGAGVSVYTTHTEVFIHIAKKPYSKVDTLFKDREDYIRYSKWFCLPQLSASAVDLTTFKDPTPIKTNLVESSASNLHSIKSLRVVRFWGFPPPEVPHGKILAGDMIATANKLKKWPMPESYASGKGTPPKGTVVEKVPVAQVPRSHPEPKQAAPAPAPVKQKKTEVVSHQHFVEDALSTLYAAGWIERKPGKPDSIGDADTKAAVRDFQTRCNVPPIDGIPGPITRAALIRALDDLRAGKPPRHKPEPAPVIDHFYWLTNHVQPGETAILAVHGVHLDLVEKFEVTITDPKTNRSVVLPVPLAVVGGFGMEPVPIPERFPTGSVLVAKLKGSKSGATIERSNDVPLYVGQQLVLHKQDDWPWDEALWTPQMRNVIAELRAAPKGSGSYARREITQYGVKEKIDPGDTPVLDKDGRQLATCALKSLFLADIEGTMRLDGRILNIVKSGNVYDQSAVRNIGGVVVNKPKPSLAKFDPQKSRWVDVTARAPWGCGSRMPLIPFRVLAHNPRSETPLFGKIVYIKQLDGLGLPTGEVHNGMCIVGDTGGMHPPGQQFDFFVGREDRHISIPTLAPSQGGSICEVEILGDSTTWRKH